MVDEFRHVECNQCHSVLLYYLVSSYAESILITYLPDEQVHIGKGIQCHSLKLVILRLLK